MKISNVLRAAALAIAALCATALPEGALAQVVTQLPQNVNNAAVLDMGNGPLELRVVQGNMLLATSQGAATSTAVAASATMVLTATPAVAPCVGSYRRVSAVISRSTRRRAFAQAH